MSIVTDVISVTNDLGEGPIWYPEENALYWVDIGRAEVFRFRPETGEQNVCALDSVVSALGIWSEQKFVAATESGFSVLRTKDPGLARIDHFLEGEHGARLNDAKVGPGGRFWAGMLHESRKKRCAILSLSGRFSSRSGYRVGRSEWTGLDSGWRNHLHN
jgi:sugar lactone lactonase YvrE